MGQTTNQKEHDSTPQSYCSGNVMVSKLSASCFRTREDSSDIFLVSVATVNTSNHKQPEGRYVRPSALPADGASPRTSEKPNQEKRNYTNIERQTRHTETREGHPSTSSTIQKGERKPQRTSDSPKSLRKQNTPAKKRESPSKTNALEQRDREQDLTSLLPNYFCVRLTKTRRLREIKLSAVTSQSAQLTPHRASAHVVYS